MPKNVFNPEQYLPGNALELVASGEPYFTRLLQIINDAQKQILFLTYIFEPDDTGKMILKALKKARQRDVEVFLTVDSYGSKSISPELIADLQNLGIHFKLFSPLPKHFYVFRLGRRLHSKVIVADQKVALVGGINIADKYRGNAQEAPWLDFALGVKGPVCSDLSLICTRIFWGRQFKKHPLDIKKNSRHAGLMRSRFALNDWFRRKNQIGAGYRAAFQEAKQSITIVASYFLPSHNLRRTLQAAAQRGVRINMLLPGISDVPMAKRATRYLYQWLLRNNIGIYEWHNSILHGKLAVVDQKWTTIGSYNLNALSQYSSIEMNLEVLDKGFSTQVLDNLAPLLEQSTHITIEYKLGIPDKFLDWASYTLARWIMLLMFFLVRREHRYKEKE